MRITDTSLERTATALVLFPLQQRPPVSDLLSCHLILIDKVRGR
jgi:hypothetical protein